MQVVVIGATGDVGQGITAALLESGHHVLAVARRAAPLASLAERLGSPATLSTCTASIADDLAAADLARQSRAALPQLRAAVIAVNGPRHLPGLSALSSAEFHALIGLDVLPHFAAARALLPVISPAGALLGIGGGSADFILAGGAHMSVAQAGLRMLYRGLAHEHADTGPAVRLLTIASVVNGTSTRTNAKPEWVTDAEIGARVASMLGAITTYPDPVYRIARRGADGNPAFTGEGPTRIQTLIT